MVKNTDHIVCLIGDAPDGNLRKVRSKHPVLDYRAKHSDMACLHCGQFFPLSACMPLGVDMLSVISKQFIKEHYRCKPGKKSAWVVEGGRPEEGEG